MLGKKSKNNFVHFLEEPRTTKFVFVIYWPLAELLTHIFFRRTQSFWGRKIFNTQAKNVFENFLSTYWNNFFCIALHFKLKEPNSMEPYNGKRAHLKCNSLSTSFSQAVLSFFFSPNALFTVLSKLYIPSTIKIDFLLWQLQLIVDF